jgi:hypothetical protein
LHSLDFDNYIRILDDYLLAEAYVLESLHLPCEYKGNKLSSKVGAHSYLHVVERSVNKTFIFLRGGSFAAYVNDICVARNAGLLYDRGCGVMCGTLNSYEDSKYQIMKNKVVINVRPIYSINADMTPAKLLLLRILNLTVLRLRIFADLFRKAVVNKIVSNMEVDRSTTFSRKITFDDNFIDIHDRLESKGIIKSAWLVPQMHLFHMASSKYFSNVYIDLEPNRLVAENVSCVDLKYQVNFNVNA